MNWTHHVARWALFGLVALSGSAFAQAAAGVSDERVNLPEAPGSIDGVGENASTEGNQGAVSYAVKVEVPQGFPGLTPQLSFSYSSSSGSDILGIGWSLPTYSIERMTVKGLQKYDVDDRFVVDGSQELVRVSANGPEAVYRLRFEGTWVRYTWKNRGTGEGGYWMAEFPDGKTGYYGADENGVEQSAARVTVPTTAKTFRYHLVAMTDRFGHAMRFTWTKDAGGVSLLDRIEYVQEGSAFRHSVRFTYENRNDVISDARPGFETRLTSRLKDIRIFSGNPTAELVRSYVLAYEPEVDTEGATRLNSVTRFGRGGVQYPVNFKFDYSKTLGGACSTNCQKPFVKDMGTLGSVSFNSGLATLLDINGDALPDVLSSDMNGKHTWYYAKLDTDGRVSFNTTGVASALATGGQTFTIGNAKVQVLDVNGDGFVDITSAATTSLLCNNGSGDWQPASVCAGTVPGVPSSFPIGEAGDLTQADPQYIRFFDYDNDKRIDWLRTPPGAASTEVLANTAAGFSSVLVDNIGAAFDADGLELADMNGDGLQDPVKLVVSGSIVSVSYRLNFGYGKWGPWTAPLSIDFGDASQAALAELEDINGDTLADLVSVVGNVVKLAINRNGNRFDAVKTIAQADVGEGTVPTRVSGAAGSVVVYADMNGNGSSDVVWLQPTGAISYLELFPVRPNLISRIDNGIGSVQTFTYGTSIAEQARDNAATMPWNNKVPNPMTVVKRVVSFVTVSGSDGNGTMTPSGLLNTTDFAYHSGYYDGIEKQFRGYEQVDRELLSDMSRDAQEPGLIVEKYDVGKTNPVLAGLTINRQVYAGLAGSRQLLRESRNDYQVCPVAQTNNAMPTISFSCLRANTDVLVERDMANAVTTRVEKDYDGYGNVIAVRDLGVVNRGTPENPTACEACSASGVFGKPCGMTCTGDERYTEGEFLEPGTNTGNAWLVGFSTRSAEGAVTGMPQTEMRWYYDGAEFDGLPAGQATKGQITRVERRNGPNTSDFVTVNRYKRDAHGNVIESIEAAGSVADATRYRRLYTMEPAGLHTIGVEIRTGAGAVAGIKKDVTYDSVWELTAQSSNWYPVSSSMPLASAQQTRYRYDEHGRLTKVLDPGDQDATPGQEFTFALADPASKITTLMRSVASGPQDIVTARCLDGKGRVFQVRSQVASNAWLVSGFTEFDGKGQAVRSYQPYTSQSANCDMTAPTGVPFVSYTYDAVGRLLTQTEADGSVSKTDYRPLKVSFWTADDTDAASAAKDTPDVEYYDGLARVVSMERLLASGGTPAVTQFTYDAMGNLSTMRDASGNVHTQTYDRLGKLTRVDSTNGGTTTYEYDANGNETSRTDARGVKLRTEWDGANRRVAAYVEGDDTATRRTWTYDFLMGCAECTNAGGEIVGVSWPGAWSGGDKFGYDPKGNLVFNQRTVGAAVFVVRRKYDGADRNFETTYPGGLTVTRQFDGRGRLTAMPNLVSSISYGERGEVDTMTWANGAKTVHTYDQKVRLQGMTTSVSAGPVMQLAFTRSRAGVLQSVTDGALAGHVRRDGTFTHDAWNRLTRAVLTNGTDMETLDFGYDVIDNLTSKTSSLGSQSHAHVGTLTYAPARPNAVADAAGSARGYDAAGNLTSRGAFNYTRDYLGRISTASGGSADGSYFYDDLDRVVKVEGDSTTIYVEDDFEVHDGISVAYARFGHDRVARLESDSLAATLLSDLAPLSGSSPTGDQTIDIADAWVAQAAATGVVSLSGGPTPSSVGALLSSAARRLLMEDVTFLHPDYLSSSVVATSADGAVRGEVSFYPTGEVREQQGYVDDTGFTGQIYDEATGLVHFRYRDYDPVTGRWDRPDPAFAELDARMARALGQATTFYAYVGNGFDGAVDPTGLANPGGTTGGTSGGGTQGTGGGNPGGTPGQTQGQNGQNKAKNPRAGQRKLLIGSIVAAAISAVLSVVSAIGQTVASGTGENGDSQMAMRYGAVGSVGAGFGAVGTGLSAAYSLKDEFGSKNDSGGGQNQTAPTSTPPPTNTTPPPTSTTGQSNPTTPQTQTGNTQSTTSTVVHPTSTVRKSSITIGRKGSLSQSSTGGSTGTSNTASQPSTPQTTAVPTGNSTTTTGN